MPDPNPLWTADTYKAFEIRKNTPPDPVSNLEVIMDVMKYCVMLL